MLDEDIYDINYYDTINSYEEKEEKEEEELAINL